MPSRAVYLAKYRRSSNQRWHFAIFIPNAAFQDRRLGQDFRSQPCQGTIIHVVGEPVMVGYALEFKRNYEISTSQDLRAMVYLGYVDTTKIYEPLDKTFVKEPRPRAPVEREAATVRPPGRGQDIKAPIDGVNTKRCQEWTMEYLQKLAHDDLISSNAVDIAQRERDPATHGIFGQRGGRGQAQGGPANVQKVWDETHHRYRYWDGHTWRWVAR